MYLPAGSILKLVMKPIIVKKSKLSHSFLRETDTIVCWLPFSFLLKLKFWKTIKQVIFVPILHWQQRSDFPSRID